MLPALRATALAGIFACLHAYGQAVVPSEFTGKVVSVKDGDTIGVLWDGKEVRVRLAHIDCPERGQPFGQPAKQLTSDLCYGKDVKVTQVDAPDRFGRLIAAVHVDGQCVNMELVRAGFAWHFLKYSSDSTYSALESLARRDKAGLWGEALPVAPWDWRKGVR